MKAKRELTKEEYKQAMDYKKAHGLPSLLSAVGVLFPDAVIFEKGDIKKSPVKVKAAPELKAKQGPEENPAAVQTAEKPKKKYLEVGDRDKAGRLITEKRAAALKKFRTYSPEDIERVKGEIVNQSLEIPQEMIDGVQNAFYDFVDLNLERQEDESPERCMRRYLKDNVQMFNAFCTYVGRNYSKKYQILKDKTYKAYGGTRYDPIKVNALSDIYLEYCYSLGVVPQMMTACQFLGVTREYIRQSAAEVNKEVYKDIAGAEGATSLLLDLGQKLKRAQEAALASRLSEGRQNPTGSIFVLKNLHGWKDERTIEHTAQAPRIDAAQLPDLTDLGLKDD